MGGAVIPAGEPQKGSGARMKIQEVSKKYDLTADTLRYYERIGLLPHIGRNESGIREYNEEDCSAIEFIKCMRGAGVSIESLLEYVTLFREGDKTRAARKALLMEERQKLQEKMELMEATMDRLNWKIENYYKWVDDNGAELIKKTKCGEKLTGAVRAGKAKKAAAGKTGKAAGKKKA